MFSENKINDLIKTKMILHTCIKCNQNAYNTFLGASEMNKDIKDSIRESFKNFLLIDDEIILCVGCFESATKYMCFCGNIIVKNINEDLHNFCYKKNKYILNDRDRSNSI